MSYTERMTQENRQDVRYNEIGRVSAAEICPLSGILDDISSAGLKMHYPFPVVLDLEEEFNLKIAPLHNSDSAPLHLLCTPQWVNEKEGSTYIGFKVLYSPDANRLAEFILQLEELNKDILPDLD